MSLYLVFLITGALLFAIVYFYSIYQQKQNVSLRKRRTADSVFKQTDAQTAVENTSDFNHNFNADNDVVEDVVGNKDEKNTAAFASKIEDKDIEYVAKYSNDKPVERDTLLAIYRRHDYLFARKTHIFGLNELTDLWCDIERELASSRFMDFGVSIQLADREGALSKKEMNYFSKMVLDFSESLDVPFQFSMDIDAAIQKAAVLDEIGRRYDAMAVLNIVPKGRTGFRMADIDSCSKDLRMYSEASGVFIKSKGHKQAPKILYRMASMDSSGRFGGDINMQSRVYDLVIYMNVPATENPLIVFDEMVEDAMNMTTWLDGKLVDRKGKVLTEKALGILKKQITGIVASMQEEGLEPGDELSVKLF